MSYYVFSDVDETLINCKSMLCFMSEFLFQGGPGKIPNILSKQAGFCRIHALTKIAGADRVTLNREFYTLFEGIDQAHLKSCANTWVRNKIREKTLYIKPVLKELIYHKANGAEIILISGSFPELLDPIKNNVGADSLICSELEIVDGVYTGVLITQMIGDDKCSSLSKYFESRDVDPSFCYAYGDHKSDISFMEKVGKPVVVGNSKYMKNYADKNNWRCI